MREGTAHILNGPAGSIKVGVPAWVLGTALACAVMLHTVHAPGAVIDIHLENITNLTQLTNGIRGNTVGFSLVTIIRNVGQDPVPWGFPVIETASNPWVADNGFTVSSSVHGPDLVGQHPHLRYSLYRQAAPGATTLRIGQSDLKHGFGVSSGTAGDHHELKVGNIDIYGIPSNSDQSFFGPAQEMDPVTFEVAAHDHLGGLYPALGSGYHRDHGKEAFSGDAATGMPADPGHPDDPNPGPRNFDHLLQAPLDLMMPAAGVKWWIAGEVYVVDDINHVNNQRWGEVFPNWDGTTLTFANGASTGQGLDTIPDIPEPVTILTLGPGLLILLTARRR